jgi:hypothetical protein
MKKVWTFDAVALSLVVAACYLAIVLYLSTATAQEISTLGSQVTPSETSVELEATKTFAYWNNANQVMLWTSLHPQNGMMSETVQLYTDWLTPETWRLAFDQQEFTVPGSVLMNGKAHYAELELKFYPQQDGWLVTISTTVELEESTPDVHLVATLELADLTTTNLFTVLD